MFPEGAGQSAKQALAKRAQELKGQQLKPSQGGYGGPLPGRSYSPPRDQDQTAAQMPNYEKLTPFEQTLYGALPGFNESTVGQALQRFSQSWAGKALQWLDVGAEAVERTAGLATQFITSLQSPEASQDFRSHLSEAWYAGSLSADFANLPTFKRDAEGKLTGFTVPTDLPGFEGLIKARKQIVSLTAQGMQPGEALNQVRDQYYNDEGALALRSQLYDTYFHIAADPLNIVLPMLKPAERLQALRKGIMATKVTESGLEDLRLAARVAEEAGDVGEVTRIASQIDKAEPLTRLDRFVIGITGGDTFNPGKLNSRLNPLALTPAARAHELLTVVTDHVNAYIMAKIDDPAQMVAALDRAARGALGPEFGHAFLTMEGRTVQATLSGFDVAMKDLYGAYRAIDDERALLQAVSEALGEDIHRLANTLVEGDTAALSRRLAEAGINVPADALKAVGETIKDAPYSNDLFKVMAMNQLADHAARQGVIQFGVKARGFLEKMSLAVKSAETMGFLRLNPAYALRNVVNNEMTMLARGLIGRVGIEDIEKFWSQVGFDPIRLSQGYGAIGEGLSTPTEVGSKVIADALRGERGFLDKVQSAFGDVKLGKLDMGEFSAKMEQAASRRAFTLGYQQGWRGYYWKPGKGFDKVLDFLPPEIVDAVDQAVPGFSRGLEQAIGSAWNEGQIDAFIGKNINLTPQAIFAEASRTLGRDVTQTLPEDFVAKIEGGLLEATEKGTVREYMTTLRNGLEQHLDDMTDDFIDDVARTVEMRTASEGPKAFATIWGDYVDEFWGAHMAHAEQMRGLDEVVRGVTDPQIQDALWRKILGKNDAHFNRAWSRMEGAIKGMRRGAKQAGFDLPGEIPDLFRNLRKETRDFFKLRNKNLEDFFKARLANKTPAKAWNAILEENDAAYRALIQSEDNLTRQMDELISTALPDEQTRNLFSAWRNRARELRLADKEGVVAFRAEIAGLSPEARAEAYGRFWQERQGNWTALWDNERQGLQMLSGDRQAAQVFAPEAAIIAEEKAAQAPVEAAVQAPQPAEVAAPTPVETVTPPAAPEAIAGTQAPVEVTRQATTRTTAFGTDPNQVYDFEYKVVDLNDLVTSNTTTGAVNPDFPKELQPRIRERTAAQQQVERIARELNPDAMLVDTHRLDSGPMIVGDDLVVESGNGRTMALRLAEQNYADRYAQYVERLRAELPNYGLTEEALQGIERPVLVRQRVSDVDRVKFAAEANQSTTLALAPFETAIQDSGFIRDSALANLSVGETQSIDQALQSTTNSDFVRSFVGQLPENERAALVDANGALNPQGLQRLKYAMFAKTYPGDAGRRLLEVFSESLAPGVRNVENALFASLPDMGRMESAARAGIIAADYSIADDISKSLDVFARLQQESLSVTDYLSQSSMFQQELDDFQRTLLQYFAENSRSQKVLRETLKYYAREALDQPPPNQITMFADVAKSQGEIFNEAVASISKEEAPLFAGLEPGTAAPAPTPAPAPAGEGLAQPVPTGAEGIGAPGPAAPAVAPPAFNTGEAQFIPDMGKLYDTPAPVGVAEDQFWLNRGFDSLDAIEEAALEQAGKPAKYLDNLPEALRGELGKYLDHVKGQMSDARYASTRFAEFKRDAALLNYNRRFNYNTWLGTIAPYEFWLTQSLAKWAIHSIDRPAMFSTYLRIKKMLEASGAPGQALPSRLKGNVRIKLPFLPDWMGKAVFSDPMRMLLPFDTFAFPYEQMMQNQSTMEGRVSRVIQDMVQNGQATPAEAEAATREQSGPLWEQARAHALNDDSELRYDAWDFVSTMTSPHAPLVWAKEIIEGTPENIGPFLPLTRMSKGISALLGIEQFPLLPHNIEAKVRKSMGLPAFDKWDDYRVERMLSNMAARGEITVDAAMRAMIDHGGEAWDDATHLADLEFGVGAVGSTLGIPLKAYPEGEFLQRQLSDDFSRAYEKYKNGDVAALTDFFDDNPEYETRLALFKQPEERMRQFLVDQLWNTYNDLPSLQKKEINAQMPREWNALFLNKDTRSYDSIPLDDLQIWVKLMGGDPPGTLSEAVAPLELAPLDISNRAQVFYNQRNNYFPDWYELQDKYYKLTEQGDVRKQFREKNAQLADYWDWRRDWFHRNPDVVPYLSDTFEFSYQSEAALNKAEANQPTFSWNEWMSVLPQPTHGLITDYVYNGDPLPETATNELESVAANFGMTYQELLDKLSYSLGFGPDGQPNELNQGIPIQ